MTREEALGELRFRMGYDSEVLAVLGLAESKGGMSGADAAERIRALEKTVARLSVTLSTVETQIAVYRFWRP